MIYVSIFLEKLEKLGITGTPHKLFKSYQGDFNVFVLMVIRATTSQLHMECHREVSRSQWAPRCCPADFALEIGEMVDIYEK